MTRTLLDISDDMIRLDALLMECNGVISESEHQAEIEELLSGLDTEFKNKADGYAALVTEMGARAKVRREQAGRMAQLASVDENAANWLKSRLKGVMEAHGVRKIETERFRLTVAENGGKLPLIVPDPNRVPDAYCTQPAPVPSNDKIRAALDKGEKLLFAMYGERGTHLRIK